MTEEQQQPKSFSQQTKQTEEKTKIGLVLNAGGARGAYQAGVLKRIGEVSSFRNRPSPFPIIAGASAGALNGSAIAAGSGNFSTATQFLSTVWSTLSTEQVYRTDAQSLMKNGSRFFKDLALGGAFGGGRAQSFLDPSPLKKFLSRNLPMELIGSSISQGHLYALAISATNYYSGKNFIFIQGQANHPTWEKSRRVAFSTRIGLEHICASSAIPIVFPAVCVPTPWGDFYFGDGGLRLVNPLSPAIRLGARKIFAVGIRCQLAWEKRSEDEMISRKSDRISMRSPSLAHVTGVIMNSIFLDHLDADVEHLERMNELIKNTQDRLKKAGEAVGRASTEKSPQQQDVSMSVIEPLVLNPSFDIGQIACQYADRMPKILQYFLEGLGGTKSESAELMSYLNFDANYTRDLIDLGYQDAHKRIDEIEHFLLK